MPVQLSDEATAQATAKLDSSLSAIFDEEKVRRDVRAALANLDVDDCEFFSFHSDDVDLAKEGTDKVAVAIGLCSVGGAQERTKAQRTQQAEARSASLPATIPGSAHCHEACLGRESCCTLTPGQTFKASELPAMSCADRWTTGSSSLNHWPKSRPKQKKRSKPPK